MPDLVRVCAEVTGTPAPGRQIPAAILWPIAAVRELVAGVTGRPALLGLATMRIMRAEAERTRFTPAKSRTERGLTFRPIAGTIRDEVAWFRAQGMAGVGSGGAAIGRHDSGHRTARLMSLRAPEGGPV